MKNIKGEDEPEKEESEYSSDEDKESPIVRKFTAISESD